MKAYNFELKNLKENEGIIIGSYLVNAKEWLANEHAYGSLYTYIGVKQLSDLKFEITMEKDNINFLSFRPMYKDNVSPGKEFVFIKNAPEGTYYIDTVQKTGTDLLPTLLRRSGGRAKVKVTRGKVTYIGRLVVNVSPGKISGKDSRLKTDGRFGKFSLQVEEAQEKSLADLKDDYAEFLLNVERKLMTISK